MGNCQAIDGATLVLQHPNGKEEKLYRSVTACRIMKMNPGYHVALLLSSAIFAPEESLKNSENSVRLTRVKLLRPSESLLLGQVYRLITAREVMKGLWEKQAKMKKKQFVTAGKAEKSVVDESDGTQKGSEERKQGRNRGRKGKSISSAASKSRAWQPSLQSISEAAS